jgi:Methyltransferase FkbM domain
MISVGEILQKFALTRFGLIKIDIEGGEQELFGGPTEWLACTDAVIIESHPTIVDYPRLTRMVKYIPADSFFPGNMDSLTRVN